MIISLEKVQWRAGDFALEVSVALSSGVTGIFGPSGAGKTTLIELIAGIRRPTAGSIRLGDRLVAGPGAWVPPEYRQIGYVPQDALLFPHLSVAENLRFGLLSRGGAGGRFDFDAVVGLLGLGGLLDARATVLSGGERQRVALGRALLSQPNLLLLDEPMASVDREKRETLLPYFQKVRDETKLPMLYISHAADELVALADSVVVLEAGRIVRHGSAKEVFYPVQTITHHLRD